MDTTTIILIVAIIALVLFFLSRNRAAARGPYVDDPYARGNQRPTYDDPNYTSSGSIGGGPAPEPPRERSVGGTSSSRGGDYDDPNYRSGGSIGG